MTAFPPKTMINPPDAPPIAYKLFHHKQVCHNCSRVHMHTDFMAMYAHPLVKTGFIYVPCHRTSDVAFNAPVQVETKVYDATPYCFECYKPGILSHLPVPPKPTVVKIVVGGPQVTPPQPKTKPVKQPKGPKTYTIDDLDI